MGLEFLLGAVGLEGLEIRACFGEPVERVVVFGACILFSAVDIVALVPESILAVLLDIPGPFGSVVRGAEPDSVDSFRLPGPGGFVDNIVGRVSWCLALYCRSQGRSCSRCPWR